jgi:F420H(2)-dependent quinone reductase
VLGGRRREIEIALGLRFLGLLQFLYEKTDGRIGSRLAGIDLLLLRTTGRTSGTVRTAELLYVPDGPNYVVVGSRGGSDRPPAWVLNLRAHPEAEVQVGRERRRVRARFATGSERARLWRRVNEKGPYDSYQAKTVRQIPIVVLEPVPEPPA